MPLGGWKRAFRLSTGSETGSVSGGSERHSGRETSQPSHSKTEATSSESCSTDTGEVSFVDRGLHRQATTGGPSAQRIPATAPRFVESNPPVQPPHLSNPSRGIPSVAILAEGQSTVSGNTSVGMVQTNNPFHDIQLLRDVPQAERVETFRRKLQACSTVYDFNRPGANVSQKDAKKQTLLEIVEYVNNQRNAFHESVTPNVIEMVSANIFRSLPPTTAHVSIMYEPEEEEPTLESSWPHLQIVYEFFLRFVVSNDVEQKTAKKYIDSHFVLKLLELFNSEDPRERDYLKTILHRIYGKIMPLRSFIRKAIQHVFFKFIYENEAAHNGISELLEILGSIINGFALPLKEEHKLFLSKSLIPLHKARGLTAFHQQLSYCMTQYVEKDNRLAESIIMGLLRYWPITNTPKEVMFIHELEEILELTQGTEFHNVMELLFKKIAACIQSPHFQVAERVLYLWHNDQIAKMINQNKVVLFPIIIAALYKNSKEHWNNTVAGLTFNVSKLLAEADPSLFDDCSDKNVLEEERRQQMEDNRAQKWAELQSMYDSKVAAGVIEDPQVKS
eukprot:Selendium_serpulae@DN6095_c0_g2_i5.p1